MIKGVIRGDSTIQSQAKEDAYPVMPDASLFSPRRVFNATRWWLWWTYKVGDHPLPYSQVFLSYRRPWASRHSY